jgi:hypothetical protein
VREVLHVHAGRKPVVEQVKQMMEAAASLITC